MWGDKASGQGRSLTLAKLFTIKVRIEIERAEVSMMPGVYMVVGQQSDSMFFVIGEDVMEKNKDRQDVAWWYSVGQLFDHVELKPGHLLLAIDNGMRLPPWIRPIGLAEWGSRIISLPATECCAAYIKPSTKIVAVVDTHIKGC